MDYGKTYHKRLYWLVAVMEADLNESGRFKCLGNCNIELSYFDKTTI